MPGVAAEFRDGAMTNLYFTSPFGSRSWSPVDLLNPDRRRAGSRAPLGTPKIKDLQTASHPAVLHPQWRA